MVTRNIDVSIDPTFPTIDPGLIVALFEALDQLETFSIPDGDLSIALVDEVMICDLHNRFLGDPSPTDVITFPGDPDEPTAGEIIVSVDQVKKEHARHKNTPDEELMLYLVHGWLHLTGEDDLEEEARTHMRAAERSVIDALGPVQLYRSLPPET